MRIWRNSSPKREQERTVSRDLIKTDIRNRPKTELKTTIVRIMDGLENSIEDIKICIYAYHRDKRHKNWSTVKFKNAMKET